MAIDRPTHRADDVIAQQPTHVMTPHGRVDVEDTSRGQVLTRDFLNSIPAGRSHQSAVGVASGVVGGGGNPNMAGGTFDENRYMIDGVNITDPVTGTFSLNFKYAPLRPNHTALIAPYELAPQMGTGTNSTDVRIALAGGTTRRLAGGVAASGALVRDRVWMAARADHGAWKDTRQSDIGMSLRWMPSGNLWARASVHHHTLELSDGIGHWSQVSGRLSLAASNRTTLHADTLYDARMGRMAGRVLALAQLRGVVQLPKLTLSADATAGGLSSRDTARQAVGESHARAVYELGEHSVAHAQVGFTHRGSTVLTGQAGAKLQVMPWTDISLAAQQSTPTLTETPAASAPSPVTRSAAASVRQQVIEDVYIEVGGELAAAQTWGASADVFAADGGAPVLADRGGALQARLTKIDAKRWTADASYTYQRRRPGDPSALRLPDAVHFVDWTDRLRPHTLAASGSWRLPTDPWGQTISADVRWMSAVDGATGDWAAARLHWGLAFQQDLDVRIGTIALSVRVDRGANAPQSLTGQPTSPTVPWTRLDPEALAQTRVLVGVAWPR